MIFDSLLRSNIHHRLEKITRIIQSLKPGGYIYVNANDIGWYAWIKNITTKDYNPKKLVSDTF